MEIIFMWTKSILAVALAALVLVAGLAWARSSHSDATATNCCAAGDTCCPDGDCCVALKAKAADCCTAGDVCCPDGDCCVAASSAK